MKPLNLYIQEKLVVNKNYNPYTCAPKSWNELREIIEDRYDKLGPGTEQKPIDFNDIDVSNINSFFNVDTNMGIFEKTEFEYINISDWNVSEVKNMKAMFYKCYNLKSVGDLSDWDVSNAKDMERMFFECEKLKSAGDLSNWDVSKVEYMIRMFFDCKHLKSVGDLSNWKVSKVEYMTSMFWGCSNLKSVGDLSDWDVSSVKNMNGMFYVSEITNIPDWYEE